jgi:hypothetical protein
MAQVDSSHTTKLSSMFRDPFLQTAFRAAEGDGLAPVLVETDHPRTLDGGAAERMTEIAGRRVMALVEA